MTGMLKRKVIVVSGVGPGLGTTLAHRCARDGADLVLAARSAERLDDVAKQTSTPGDGRWRCAPTSPTTTT